MKKPEEIKKGLEVCSNDTMLCYEKCPYFSSISNGVDCAAEMKVDALAYIQQLEADKVSLLESSHEMRKEMISKIKQLEAKVPKWISVEDDKPKEYENVNVYVAGDDGCRYTNTGFYDGKHWRGYGNRFDVVTHWTPLPEPPVEV